MVIIVRLLLIYTILAATPLFLFGDFLKEGRIGHYEFECNTEDSGQTGATLIEFGDPECVESGKLLRSYHFDGDDALIFPTNTSAQYYSTSGFTWSVWINADSLPTAANSGFGMGLVSFADPRDGRDVYLGFGSPYTNKRELTFIVDGAGGAGGSAFLRDGICRYYPSEGFQDSTWIHITGVRDYDNDRVSLYVDGLLVATKSFQVDEPISDNNHGSIAAYTEGDEPLHFFKGLIDEVRFYERPFSEEEVLKLYSLKPDQLRSDTSQLDFGMLFCQQDTTITLDVYNIGPSNFDITEISMVNGSVFSFTDPSPLTLTYPEGDSLSIDITFTPADSRVYNDTIMFYNNLDFPPLAIALSGSRAGFSVDTVSFEPQLICDTGYRYELDFTLDDMLAGNMAEIANISSSYSDLTIDKSAGDTLGLTSSDNFTLTFSPSGEVYLSEEIEISFNDCFLRKKIIIEGAFIADSIEYPELVDFEVVAEGSELDTIIAIRYPALVKLSSDDITILDYEWENESVFIIKEWEPTGDNFQIEEDSIFIHIGGEATANLSSSTLKLHISTPCGRTEYPIPLSVNGQYVASGNIKAVDISANSYGQEVDVAIEFSDLNTIAESGLTELSFDLVWNGSILTAPQNISLVAERDYKVRSSFTVPISEISSGIYLLFTGQGTLGNTRQDSIWVENISAEGGYYDFTGSGGQVDINVPGFNASDMLLFDDGELSLEIFPNPIVDLTLTGEASWLLRDGSSPSETLIGTYTVLDLIGNTIQEGEINLNSEFNISLPENTMSGSYIIYIESGNHAIAHNFVVVI